MLCSNPELLQKEMDHPRKALGHGHVNTQNGLWTKWRKGLTGLLVRSVMGLTTQGTTGTQPTSNEVKTKGHIVIPYTQGLCKSIKKICGRYGIQTHFKGSSTIRNLLVSPKDKDPMVSKSGAICWFQCGDLTCDDEYIGEPLGPLEKDSQITWRIPPLYIIITRIQAILLVKITFK